MLRLAGLGVWVILVTAAATYGSVLFYHASQVSGDAETADLGVEELKTDMTSVPVIRNGEVIGYVIIQMSFQADRRLLQELHVEPSPYLIDAAFRTIFSSDAVDFRRLRRSDLDRLTSEITRVSNAQFGEALIRTVRIQQLNFVRKEDIRTNWIKSGQASTGHE